MDSTNPKITFYG